ncbi:type II toxin-antitoxin system RelE family toxin [Nocardia cyriacigeorgica]|uniref:Uncharacterized protein n=1 Tax=Nocardia cyriacigeorgica TaxID=135487 RepID=A0A6P1DIG0_9NOCA|nr:hypothetical protein [Nocardia cyriacigeorgica]NEW42512.1 hypothetical protein [Nocardia cyriacigeorgica]NEW48192.1 hypothetical protein [Nocardia cyriacigeorgica]
MALNETPSGTGAVSSVLGPVRFTVAIPIPDAKGEGRGEVVTFVVNGLVVPRVGERVIFDVDGDDIVLDVMDVAHWFFTPNDGPRQREIVVSVTVQWPDTDDARKLLDPVEYERWVARFAMLESDR